MAAAPIRVLIVDDSAITRRLIAAALRNDPAIDVVAEANDAFTANALILQHRPDLVTLDLEMPRMNGLAFLQHLMTHHPVPVIIVSAHTEQGSKATVEALRAGAADVILKPQKPSAVAPFAQRLRRRILDLRECAFKPINGFGAAAPSANRVRTIGTAINAVVAIGASTGGPPALEAVLAELPADTPPVVIVQHMPASFTALFAKRLDESSPMHVMEASDRQALVHGEALVAPGGYHLLVERHNGRLETAVRRGASMHHQRPAVDVLFSSLAKLTGVPIVGVLLTGMGEDGAAGMVQLVQGGHDTIAQDERSCVVFGMPREAIARGGAKHVVPLPQIAQAIVDCLRQIEVRSRPRAVAGGHVSRH